MDKPLDLEFELLKLTLILYNNPLIPRSIVQLFIDQLMSFIYNIFFPIIKQHLNDQRINEDIDRIMDASKEIFSKFKTEHLRLETYKEKGLIQEPKKFEIKDGDFAYYVPLKWSLSRFLEIPGAFKLLKNSIESLTQNTDIISNFIQGEFWKEKLKEFGSGKFVAPLFMFYDDIELGKVTGTHAGVNKLGAVYFTIPGFPTHITSNLSNILVNTIFYSSDRVKHGNAPVFHKLVSELNYLKTNGITITIDGKPEKVYFQLGLILGDNLGLNAILGFFESFNSNCPCRICKAFIDEIRELCEEKEELIRTKEGYDNDIKNSCQGLTGISEKCFFNRVEGFHVTENMVLDIMHDVFEGFGNDSMVKILGSLIDLKYFDLDYVNGAFENFSYGTWVESNKVPQIKKEHFDKEKLRMSAAEMMCFIRYFGLLLSDKVPENEPSWKLYLLLREIVSIVTSPRLVRGHLYRFESLYKEYLENYQKLYGQFKFKLHNLNHFLRIMKRNGPLVHFWSMRYESKHRHLTQTSSSSNCKINILKTTSLKSQLMLAHTRLFENFSSDRLFFEASEPIDSKLKFLYFREDRHVIHKLNHIKINGKDYGINTVIVLEMGDNDLLKFGKVVNIFLKNNTEVKLLLKTLKVDYFDHHAFAYKVREAKAPLVLKDCKDLPDIHQCLLEEQNGNLFVVTKYIL